MRTLYIALVVGFCTLTPCFGQFPLGFKAPTLIEVSGCDESKSDLESYLKREVRSLGDVSLVENEESANYIISVVCLAAKQNGTHVGFILSITGVENRHIANLINVMKKSKNTPSLDSGLDLITQLFKYAYITKYHGVISGPKDLRQLAQEVVTTLDKEIYEPERKSINKLNEEYRTNQGKR